MKRQLLFGLALAALLVVGVAPVAVGGATLVMLGAFAIAVSVSLHRGRAIPCYCFGASSSDMIGAATMVRVVGLAGITAFVMAAQSSGALWSAQFASLDTVALLSVVASGALLLAFLSPTESLLRQLAEIRTAKAEHTTETKPTRHEERLAAWRQRAETPS